MTLLGFAVGIAVIVAIRLANASSVQGFESALDTIAGKTSLEVTAPGGLDETIVTRLGWLREFGTISPVVEGDAWIKTRTGGETIRVLGVDILRDRDFREYQLLDIRAGTREFLNLLRDPHSIILTARFAERAGLAVGQQIDLSLGDRIQHFTIRALLGNVGPARALEGSIALMDIAAAQWAFNALGHLSRIELRLANGSKVEDAERAIAARLPQGVFVERPSRRGRDVEKMLRAFQFNLSALSYISLLVGLFMIYNAVSVSVIARRPEIGSLRALGTGKGTIIALFLGEALLLSIGGLAGGLLLARYLALGAVSLTSTTVGILYRGVVSSPPPPGLNDVILASIVGLPLGLLAAAVPALEAAKVMPTEVIRGVERIETRYRLRIRNVLIPTVLLAVAWCLSIPGPVNGVPVFGFASASCMVFGGAAMTPIILHLLGTVGRRPLCRWMGVEGLLANANLSGSISRLSISVAALSISLSMMVAITLLVGSFRATVLYWTDQTLSADLYVSPSLRGGFNGQATLSPEVEQAVEGDSAVQAVGHFRRLELPYQGSIITVAGGDFQVLLAKGSLLFKAPRDGRAALRAAIGRDTVIASESFSNKHSKGVGDMVDLQVPSGRTPFRIGAVYYDYSSERGIVVMDTSTFRRHFGNVQPASMSVYLKSNSDAEKARDRILARLESRFRIFINTNRSLRREVMRVFDSTFTVTYALEVIAIFVAILGVSSTLITLILERRRDLAVMRLIGADDSQVTRMVVIEAGLLGAAGQITGLAVGFAISLLLIYVINVQSFGWTIQFHLPLIFLAQMSVAVLAATVLAGIYPARRAHRFRPTEQAWEE